MQNLYKISDDEKLVDLLRNGDIFAFEEIYRRYWAKLYTTAHKRLKSKESAEEIVQDFFAKMWTNRCSIEIHTSLAGYAFTSVKYQVLNMIQKKLVRDNYLASLPAFSENQNNSTEETVLLNDLYSNLEKGVDLLPSKCRYVFELSRKEYRSNKEIAERLGISEKTVENHLSKALKILRIRLNDAISLTLFLWTWL